MRLLTLLLLLLLPSTLLADMLIQLKDGSSLRGEVLSMDNGVYRVQTRSLGVITIPAANVQGMLSSDAGAATMVQPVPAAPVDPSAVADITTRMMQDEGLLTSIMALQSDPAMQEILKDPEVMKAVQNFDLEALRNHPKIQALMRNPRVQAIQGRLQ